MVTIARAASCKVSSRIVANRCGSTVWSMIPTVAPSGSAQMLPVCLPATFMVATHIVVCTGTHLGRIRNRPRKPDVDDERTNVWKGYAMTMNPNDPNYRRELVRETNEEGMSTTAWAGIAVAVMVIGGV